MSTQACVVLLLLLASSTEALRAVQPGHLSRRAALATASSTLIAAPAIAYDSVPTVKPDFDKLEKLRKEREAQAKKNQQQLKPLLEQFNLASDSTSFAKACDDLSLWLIGKSGLPEGLDAPSIRDVIQDAYQARPQRGYKCKETRSGICYTAGEEVEAAYASVLGVLRKYASRPGKGTLQSDGVSAANSAAF